MRITQVTINFTETCNLGDYSNTKPSIELTALLDAGDDVHAVIDTMTATAKSVLRDKIDDELERVDKPVKYYDGDCWDVMYGLRWGFVAIVPHGWRKTNPLVAQHYSISIAIEGVRSHAAYRRATYQLGQMPSPCQFFDCRSDDGISPVLEKLIAYMDTTKQMEERRFAEERQREDEERERQRAAWAAERKQIAEDDDDVDDDDVDDDDVDDE